MSTVADAVGAQRVGEKKHGKKLRVLFFMTHPIQHYVAWCQALAQRPEIDVDVLYAYRQEELYDRGFGKKYKWDMDMYSGYKSSTGKAWAPLRMKVGWWFLLFPGLIVRAFRRDALILLGVSNITAILVLLLKPLHRAKIIIRQDASDHAIRKRGLVALVKRRAYKFLMQFVDVLLSQGEQNSRFFEFYGLPRSRHVLAPVVVEETIYAMERREKRQQTREQYGAGDNFVFVASGKFEPRKRMDFLIRAFALHAKQRSDTILWIVGAGEQEEMLHALVKEVAMESRIKFLGFVLQREIANIYAAADCLVHVARRDPWPVCVLEGVRCGLPVILSSSVGSVDDVVVQGVTGFRFDENSEQQLADALTQMSSDRQKADEMAAAARSHLSRNTLNYTIDAVVKAVTAAA